MRSCRWCREAHLHAALRSRGGFTLIELVAVIAIMALLSTLAVISLRGTIDRYHMSQAKQVIELFDAKARRQARSNHQPVVAKIDRLNQRVEIGTSTFQIPRGVEIASLQLGRRVTVGTQVEIGYSRDGWSSSYVVALKRGELENWIVVLGSSGQVIPVNDRGEANELLSL